MSAPLKYLESLKRMADALGKVLDTKPSKLSETSPDDSLGYLGDSLDEQIENPLEEVVEPRSAEKIVRPYWRGIFFGLCPACGAAGLFVGLVRFADSCADCGHDRLSADVGDGPAAFLTMILGAALLAFALLVEFTFYPPLWVHLLLWVSLTAVSVILALRFTKAWLLHSEYYHDAAEGRLRQDMDDV